MNRRNFIAGLGSAAASMPVWQCLAQAQVGKPPVVGFLSVLSSEGVGANQAAAFRQGLSETGFIVGSNIEIEYRWAEGQYERSEALAVDLVRRNLSVICTNGPVGTRAAAAASASIPIVFTMGEDPLKEGIVRSLNRPGGNVTGFTDFSNQLAAKRLGLMHDTSPKASAFAMLVNPTHPDADAEIKEAQAAAIALGLQLRVLTVRTAPDQEAAFASMARSGVEALIVNPDPLFTSEREQLVTLAARYMIPAIFDRQEFPVAGGLMSYGVDRLEIVRQAGIYVGRILKGGKPGGLPVQQATKFEFVVNLNAAKALNLQVPSGVLAIVDRVIE